MTCQHGIDRFASLPEPPHIGTMCAYHPTECRTCDAIEKMQMGVKVGMRVHMSEFNFEMEGTITAIDPCDGNGCKDYPHPPGELCGEDYIIIAEDDDMVYSRWHIDLVDV